MSGLGPVAVASQEYGRVAAWLFEEARMLDQGRFQDWLALMSVDLVYRMPVREAILPRDGGGIDPEIGFFIENFSSLKTRVARLGTDQAWAEQPASRTRHLISNIQVEQVVEGLVVTSAFLVARIRSDNPYDLFTGERQDLLREESACLRLVRRTILLDQTIIKSSNLSMFF